MGDGEDGLAFAILAVAVAMVVAGFLLMFVLGWFLGRSLHLKRGKVVLLAIASGLAGIGLGSLAVVATFFEDTWSPPPHLRIDVAKGFRPNWVILIEDPSAPSRLVWRGYNAPFHGISAEIAVPLGGVIRVRSLARVVGRGGTDVSWSDGASAVGFASGSLPTGAQAADYVAYERQTGAASADDSLPDGDALIAYIRSHGG